MATVILGQFNGPKEVVGLNTYQYTATVAATHVAKMKVDRSPNSAFTLTINNNGSPISTVTVAPVALSVQQSSQNLIATFPCAVNDVITYVITSSAVEDQQKQACKAILELNLGAKN